jgi:hypothetical protein
VQKSVTYGRKKFYNLGPQVKVAGDASSFTVVTMHSDSTTTTFDPLFVSSGTDDIKLFVRN